MASWGETPLSWVPEPGCWLDGESTEPASVRLPDIFQDVRPLRSLQATSEVPGYADVVSGPPM